MDNRVRDLDQIQELEGEDQGRKLGTILMAAAAIVGLSLAVGVVVGRAAEPVGKVDDPLAKLERNAAHPVSPAGSPVAAEPVAPKVDVEKLSFPNTLSEDEERPEVLAALKAAQAEAAELTGTANAPKLPVPKLESLANALRAALPHDDDDAEAAPGAKPKAKSSAPPADETTSIELAAEDMVANIPAAVVAASGARTLRKAVKHDPLVAAAVRNTENKTAAPHGHDGEYTLQVISYDRAEPSRAFADGLREKGHAAFVAQADVEDRGRFYRVRIGPFKTREAADAYRKQFEEQEHMNTFVVHEKVEKPPAP